jgi:hypothetical protein
MYGKPFKALTFVLFVHPSIYNLLYINNIPSSASGVMGGRSPIHCWHCDSSALNQHWELIGKKLLLLPQSTCSLNRCSQLFPFFFTPDGFYTLLCNWVVLPFKRSRGKVADSNWASIARRLQLERKRKSTDLISTSSRGESICSPFFIRSREKRLLKKIDSLMLKINI